MKQGVNIVGLALVGIFGLSMTGYAQDVDVPFTWDGKGTAYLATKEEIQNVDFKLKISVDKDGIVTGEATAEDGNAAIERLYYTENTEGVRQLVLVISTKEENPKLILLVGRALKNRLFYGEIYSKKIEKDGAVEKGLDIGNKAATQFSEESIPGSVKTAMKAGKLIGCFKVSGDFSKKE